MTKSTAKTSTPKKIKLAARYKFDVGQYAPGSKVGTVRRGDTFEIAKSEYCEVFNILCRKADNE